MATMADIKYAQYQISRVRRLLLKCQDMMDTLNVLTCKEDGDFHGLIARCNQIIESLKKEELQNAN
jgi:hypothetical protein